MKSKKLNILILIIKSLLLMSRRAVRKTDEKILKFFHAQTENSRKDNEEILKLLHAQTEMMMLNRHDITMLARNMQIQDNKNVPQAPKRNNTPNMYG